jgi:hypothetical protein
MLGISWLYKGKLMKFSASRLKSYDLFATHEIVLVAGWPTFKRVKKSKSFKNPSVYVWASLRLDDNEYEVLYVGKAGKGIDRRCSQHQGGFTNSGTGRKNAEVLKAILNVEGAAIHVFSRESKTTEIFGQEVSLYSVEEDALCAALNPRLNRAAFPVVGVATVTAALLEAEAVEMSAIHTIKDLIDRRFVEHEQGALDDMMAQIESYDSVRQNTLLNILKFIEMQILSEGHGSKLVKGYGEQLQGLNGITLLGYGLIDGNGRMLPGKWVARVFFAAEPRLVFPITKLCVGARDLVESNERTFSPLNIAEFLDDPKKFLRLEA